MRERSQLMKFIKLLFCLLLFTSIIGCSSKLKEEKTIKEVAIKDKLFYSQENYYPTKEWRKSIPEVQGMDSTQLADLFNEINESYPSVNSTIVIRNGYIVAEMYRNGYSADIKQYIYSATKSILSGLVGIAYDQGLVSLDEKITDIFSNRNIRELEERKKKITVEHLLMMREGLDQADHITYGELLTSDDPVQFILDLPMREEPGLTLNYNSSNSHLLSAIIQEKSGMTTTDFAQRYLFEPLGIQNYYFADLQGVALGSNGLMMTPRDVAKIGELYLNDGEWEGKQILSKDWIKASTTTNFDDKLLRSFYGYHWYIDEFQGQPVYYAAGSFGQYLFIVPELDIVAVFTAGKDSPVGFESLIDLVEPYIMDAVVSDEMIKENQKGYKSLTIATKEKQKEYTFHNTKTFPSTIERIQKKSYKLSPNNYDYEKLSMIFEKENAELSIQYKNGKTEVLDIGFSNFIVNQVDDSHVSVKSNWEDEHTLKINFRILEALFDYSWTIQFDENFQSFKLKELSENGEVTIIGKMDNNS